MTELTLYFDGQCNVCAREIALLRRLSADNIVFTDIHNIADFSNLPSKQHMLKRLHARSESGEWFLGLDATIKIWRQTKYGYLVKILTIPGIRQIAKHVYQRWADRRYCKRYEICSGGIQ